MVFFEDVAHGCGLGDVDGEDEFPLEGGEGILALAVDLVEGKLVGGGVGIGAGFLELHGVVLAFGEFLDAALGVGLVFLGSTAAHPVDGAELDHFGEEGDDFLEEADRLDGGALVGSAEAGEFGEGFVVNVLGVGAGDAFALEEVEAEGAEEGVEAVPLAAGEGVVAVAFLELVEFEVGGVAAVFGVVVEVWVALGEALGGDVVAGGIDGGFDGLGGELGFGRHLLEAGEESVEDVFDDGLGLGIGQEGAFPRATGPPKGSPPSPLVELQGNSTSHE